MNRGAWWATVHRVTNSRTRLSNTFSFTCATGLFRNAGLEEDMLVSQLHGGCIDQPEHPTTHGLGSTPILYWQDLQLKNDFYIFKC